MMHPSNSIPTVATTPVLTPDTDSGNFQAADVATISAAHCVHDTYSAFLAPLLPYLIEKLTMTRTAAGLLTVFYQGPSLFQPLIGHLGDRKNLRILVIMSPTIGAIIFSLLGLVPAYGLLALLLVVAGFNSAGLHAIGPVLAGQLSGSKLGRGMSFWMVGGEFGRTLGPLIMVAAVTSLTPAGLPALIPGGLVASAFLYWRLRNISDHAKVTGQTLAWKVALDQLRPIILPLTLVITARSFLTIGLSSFLPTYITEQGEGLWFAGASLSIMQVAGVVGALTGGTLSDRLGRRRVLIFMSLAAPLSALLFLYVEGWLRLPILLLVGFTLLSTTPVLMALVQERVTGGRSLANGVFMALNFVITSLAVVGIGAVGDAFSLHTSFLIATIIMALGTPFVFSLTQPYQKT